MKFLTTSYHYHLLQDWERLTAFYEAITTRERGTVFDLGAGSGILSYFAAPYSKIIYSIELNSKSAAYADINLKKWENITIINSDACEVDFPSKADLIICEMLDTALIDEEQVPVINNALKHLDEQGEIIPSGVIKTAELVYLKNPQISYEDLINSKVSPHQVKSALVTYKILSFYHKIKEDFKQDIIFTVNQAGKVNGIKLTMFTLLNSNLICGPTPMFNPPLLIPIDELELKKNDRVNINLEYTMGGGLDTIKTRIKEIF